MKKEGIVFSVTYQRELTSWLKAEIGNVIEWNKDQEGYKKLSENVYEMFGHLFVFGPTQLGIQVKEGYTKRSITITQYLKINLKSETIVLR